MDGWHFGRVELVIGRALPWWWRMKPPPGGGLEDAYGTWHGYEATSDRRFDVQLEALVQIRGRCLDGQV